MSKIKRRKPDALRKDEIIRIRVTADERRMFKEAAERLGLSMSAWLVERGRKAAMVERHEAAKLAVSEEKPDA